MLMFTAEGTSNANNNSLGSYISAAADGSDSTTVYLYSIKRLPALVSRMTEHEHGADDDDIPTYMVVHGTTCHAFVEMTA